MDDIVVIFFPSITISPDNGFINLAIVFSKVDLPHPLEPIITLTLLLGTLKSIPSIIIFLSYPVTIFLASNVC